MGWYNTKFKKWFNISIENPFKTYRKASKYFKKPKWKWRFHLVTRSSGYPYASWIHLSKILNIWIQDVWWKDKWDTPRHERNPIIYICLFKKFAFTARAYIYYYNEFGEKQNGDMEYWEYVLNWLYYKEKKTLRCYSTWVRDSELYRKIEYGEAEDGSDDKYIPYKYICPTVAMSLNKEGIKELKKELKNG